MTSSAPSPHPRELTSSSRHTPAQASFDLIRAFLDHCDNSGNPYSDATLVAAFVEALGYLRVVGQEAFAGIIRLVRGEGGLGLS